METGARFLAEVLAALEAVLEFLLKGDVFTPDLLTAYIKYKKTAEVDPMRLRRIRMSSHCITTSRPIGARAGRPGPTSVSYGACAGLL